MKLLTHNMLACHIKGVKNNYPFLIEAIKVESRDADYDPDFLRHIFPRIQWPAFLQGAQSLGCREGLPEAASEEMLQDDSFLQRFHHALLEVTLLEGALVCPETGRKFPVSKGIPNLLLNEDEC
uniref:Multifunctional methyltransferase subunit TRM112-like protein n=1 Tax=Chlamydomonas leiostraca TaxID=1034604 RepID=A0A7S0WW86_9CHLO|mmetsp:Transcript_30622/g.78164  ORF Transcript_30622/g.78164 Transcript_30622/m.78164 type:complete len:124 (+) Transcript_30622:61-432(+)